MCRMTKQYNLHSVRIEDDTWARVKASGISVNQLLLKALDLEAGTAGLSVQSLPILDAVGPAIESRQGKVTAPYRGPLLKPSQR